MSEREAFIRCILENPEDDVARLVFADWLDEHDEGEYAWYIRSSIAEPRQFAHQYPPDAAATTVLHRTRDELIPIVHAMPIPDVSFCVLRGFVSHIELPCAAFMEHAEAIFRAHPVTEVKLTNCAPSRDRFFPGVENEAQFWLWDLERYNASASYLIPWKIYRELPREKCFGRHHAQYRSEQEAFDALSVACVRYGRKLAGLPPPPIAAPAV